MGPIDSTQRARSGEAIEAYDVSHEPACGVAPACRRGGRRFPRGTAGRGACAPGEQLVVLAHGDVATAVVAQLDRLGAQMIRTDHLEEVDLVTAAVERAKAAVILGDDDVLAVRVALAVEELAPDCRLVIEMANPTLGEMLAPLLGDCTGLVVS